MCKNNNLNLVPDCFSNYISESIECMRCEYDSECVLQKKMKLVNKKFKLYPKCEGCSKAMYCKESPCGCFGTYFDCDDNYCSCRTQCAKYSFNKSNKVTFKVIKSVNCCCYSNKKLLSGEIYEAVISEDNFIYIKDDEYIIKLFDLHQDIYKKYIIINK